jgi:heat shock protein HslJ
MNAPQPRRLLLAVLPLAVGVGLALGLAASASSDAGGDGRDDPDTIVEDVQVQLAGRTFESTSVTGHELEPDTAVHLTFVDDVLAVTAGCNTMVGDWTDDDGELAWKGEPATTRMACSPELTAQDEWLSGLLTDGMTISDDDDADLTLESDDVTIELEAQDEPAASALLGRTWTVVGVIDDGSSSRLPQSVTNPTLVVAASGDVAVDTACNTGRTTVRIEEETMEFGTLALTQKGCSPLLSSIEHEVTGVLDGTVAKLTDGSVLILTKGDRGLILSVR